MKKKRQGHSSRQLVVKLALMSSCSMADSEGLIQSLSDHRSTLSFPLGAESAGQDQADSKFSLITGLNPQNHWGFNSEGIVTTLTTLNTLN